jgi:acetyltransferase-like isoleucine patch superfamily enzyme
VPVKLTQPLINALGRLGITTQSRPGVVYPDDSVIEAPCSLKRMAPQHSLRLGAFSYAASGYFFACRIGRYCSFGEQVQVGRHPHPMAWASTSPFFYRNFAAVIDQPLPDGIELNPSRDFPRSAAPVTLKTTTIGNDVWIGHGAFIMPGVSIGDGAVIAAMSVVTRDVAPYDVVAGSPATVKRQRLPADVAAALMQCQWWDFAPWQLKGAPADDPLAFASHVAALREQGVTPWEPDRIQLAALAAEVAGTMDHPPSPY